MKMAISPRPRRKPYAYILEEQIGFMLRRVSQRHSNIFAEQIGGGLTPTQWAAMTKLMEIGPVSQNQLGRSVAVDVATIKGVIDRLTARGLTETSVNPRDSRRLIVELTKAGQQLTEKTIPNAIEITAATLAPLTPRERKTLLTLLSKLRKRAH